MIVYVESNFLLELAYLQEQHESCEQVVEFAEAKRITLLLPAFSISEPYESFTRRYKDRRQLLDRLQREISELGRSKPYSTVSAESADITNTFVRSLEEEQSRLDATVMRVLQVSETIPTTPSVLESARRFRSEGLLRSPQDAIVYASVLEHLQRAPGGPKCFINKNAKDFADPDVESSLAAKDCKFFPGFASGVGYVQSHLTSRA